MQAKKTTTSKPLVNPQDIKFALKIAKKNWYLPLVLGVISYLIAYVYVHKLVDIYGASTQILLRSNDTYQEKSLIGFDYGAFQQTTNQMKVIKSADLISAVIEKMEMDVSYFLVGRLKTTEVYKGVPFKVKVKNINPKGYSTDIGFKVIDLEKYRLSYNFGGIKKEIEGNFGKELINSDLSLMVNKQANLNEITIKSIKDLDYFFKVQNPNKLISKYTRELNVTNEEFTNILTLKIEDEIPERAVAFLDTLCKEYIDYSLQSQITINENTVKYIDRQLEEIVGILDSIEILLVDFKEEKSILNLGREEESYFTKLDSYDAELNSIDLHVETLNDLEKYIIEKKDPELLPPSIYVSNSDGFLKAAVSELYELQMNRNKMLFTAKDETMVFENIDYQIEKLKENLLTYIGNSRTALREKKENVNQKYGKYYATIKTLPSKQRALLNITRKQQVNEKMYLFLLEKRANAVIARANIVSDKKVIESPRSNGVIKPDKSKIYNSFIAIGLLVAAIIVTIRTIVFSRIETFDELKSITEYPIWGDIMHDDSKKTNYLVVEENPKSSVTESFRIIRTNINYALTQGNTGGSVVMITSNSPGEGKTFSSLNLAAILAKGGKKVLLLEFDLHKPKIGVGLNLKSDKGLSTILTFRDKVEECVLQTHVPNLETILAGPVPPNASDLILSSELDKILSFGRENYEYIIIDTPPIGLITDSLVLIKHADITMFVLNTKFATKQIVKDVTEVMLSIAPKNFGFLLNGVRQKKSKYYYNRYSYGYGYGSRYGYGYGNTSNKE